MMKVFDLRLPGGKVYYAADLEPCVSKCSPLISSAAPRGTNKLTCCDYHRDSRLNRHNYNLFTHTSLMSQMGLRIESMDTPIYSLSSPSPCSPTIFAGSENHILELDVVSVMDRNPDPIYQKKRWKRMRGKHILKRWDPTANVITMALYEHDEGAISLNMQRGVDYAIGCKKGWDERWMIRASDLEEGKARELNPAII